MKSVKIVFFIFIVLFHLYCIMYNKTSTLLFFSMIAFDSICLYLLFAIGKRKGLHISIISTALFFVTYGTTILFSYQRWNNEFYFSNLYLLYILFFLDMLLFIPSYPPLSSKKTENLFLSILVILSSFFGMMFFLTGVGFILGVLSGNLY